MATYDGPSYTVTASTTNEVWYYWTSDSATATTANVTVNQSMDGGYTWHSVRLPPPPQPVEYFSEPPQCFGDDRLGAPAFEEPQCFGEAIANEKARELFELCLSKEQVKQYDKEGRFFVNGGDGNLYMITNDSTYNVKLCDKTTKQPVTKYCFVPNVHLPKLDVLVMQKLAMEIEPTVALAVANRAEVR